MREDGTIGKAYGYQIAKYKQLDKLIQTIKEDPSGGTDFCKSGRCSSHPHKVSHTANVQHGSSR